MSAVVEFVSDVVGGVAEAVGDVVEGVVDIVEDVGSAIDDYVIQPILDDPLTAIATAAGAYYLGPMAASQFGTTAAVGAGLGAAAGNFTAGMAQGEEFDEALKGATLAGLTVGVTKGAFDSFGTEGVSGPGEVGVDIDAFGNPIDAGAGTNSYVSGFEGATPGPGPDLAGTTTLGDFSFGDGFGGSEVGVDIDAFGNPIDPMANPYANYATDIGARPTPASAVAGGPSPSFLGEGYGGSEVGVDIDAFGRPIDPLANPYANYAKPPAPPSQYALDAGQGPGLKATPLDTGMPSQYSLTQTMPGDYSLVGQGSSTMMGSPGTSWLDKIPTFDQLTSLDYYKDLAGAGLDYAIENPLTTAGGALLAYSALNQPEIPGGPPVRQPGESDEQFKTRLKLYLYRRQQTPVTDIYNYGYGPQQQFFTPAQFVPIETAADGGLMGQAPGYYRYGRQPTGMAMGGRMINSPLAQYGQGGAHGRSDDVPLVLSDGEYVIDAETVALLGNGSVDAGANQLDRMREEIRRHKGRNLAQGKISPDARSPLSYLKG